MKINRVPVPEDMSMSDKFHAKYTACTFEPHYKRVPDESLTAIDDQGK